MLYFYLSYARSSDDPFIADFFHELCHEIRLIEGLGRSEDVGFMDTLSIQIGERLPDAQRAALATCQRFVALYSPRYFRSQFCGREWWIFSRRLREHEAKPGVRAPDAILPVLWRPVDEYPESAGPFGSTNGGAGISVLFRLRGYGHIKQRRTLASELAENIVLSVRARRLAPARVPAEIDSAPSAWSEGMGWTRSSPVQLGRQVSEELLVPATSPRANFVFLCHSSGDKPQVRDLHDKLRSDGIRCWFDEIDLLGGQDWDREISNAIKRARYVIACLSAASTSKRGYVQKELRKALDVADEQPDGAIYLIPVRLEECPVPDRLRRLQYIDLFDPNGYGRLLRALRVSQ